MDVRVRYSGPANDPGDEYQASCSILVDGVSVAEGGNFAECPEDANLGRDLKFIYRLPDVLKAAYEAGQHGEPFTLVTFPNTPF